MVMTLRRHNPPHLGPAIVWYLWLMISTNRFVIFLWVNMNGREHGKRVVICYVFILFWVQTTYRFQTETCLLFVCLYTNSEGGVSQTGWTSSSDSVVAPSICFWSGKVKWKLGLIRTHTEAEWKQMKCVCSNCLMWLVSLQQRWLKCYWLDTSCPTRSVHLSHQLSDHFFGFAWSESF